MEDLDYLFTAFAVVWVAIFAYLLAISLKQKRLRHEIESLEKRVRSIAREGE